MKYIAKFLTKRSFEHKTEMIDVEMDVGVGTDLIKVAWIRFHLVYPEIGCDPDLLKDLISIEQATGQLIGNQFEATLEDTGSGEVEQLRGTIQALVAAMRALLNGSAKDSALALLDIIETNNEKQEEAAVG